MTVVRDPEDPAAEELRLCAVLKPGFRAKAELFRFCAAETAQNRHRLAGAPSNPRKTVNSLHQGDGDLVGHGPAGVIRQGRRGLKTTANCGFSLDLVP